MSKPERMGDFPRLPGDLERELGDARGILSSCCRCYVDFGVEVVAWVRMQAGCAHADWPASGTSAH